VSSPLGRIEGKEFYTTHQGYLGLGPLSTQVGDHACLLFGGDVPYILRPMERGARNTYTFIGEAYVHGWVNAEMTSIKKINRTIEKFILV
jgi:hypothetical protein